MKLIKPGIKKDPVRYQGIPWLEEWRANRDARYRLLACGHYTDKPTQEAWSLWRPGAGLWKCEVCWKWVPLAPKPVYEELPDEPPF